MKRVAFLAVTTLALLAVPASSSARVVAVKSGYAHTSVRHTTVVNTGCCYGGPPPGARAATVAAGVVVGAAIGKAASKDDAPAAATTTATVGAIVPALPGGCATVQVSGVTYHQCSGVYYRPYYQGTTLVYQVSKP